MGLLHAGAKKPVNLKNERTIQKRYLSWSGGSHYIKKGSAKRQADIWDRQGYPDVGGVSFKGDKGAAGGWTGRQGGGGGCG